MRDYIPSGLAKRLAVAGLAAVVLAFGCTDRFNCRGYSPRHGQDTIQQELRYRQYDQQAYQKCMETQRSFFRGQNIPPEQFEQMQKNCGRQ